MPTLGYAVNKSPSLLMYMWYVVFLEKVDLKCPCGYVIDAVERNNRVIQTFLDNVYVFSTHPLASLTQYLPDRQHFNFHEHTP